MKPTFAQGYLRHYCVGPAESVINVSNHRESVGARNEVLLNDDCGSSTCSFKTAGAALEHHVSGGDSRSKVHRTVFDYCRKAIDVGRDIGNFAGRMRDVRVVGVRQEFDPAGAAEQSKVSSVTRYHDGRTDDVAGAIGDEGCEAISIGGKRTLSCAGRNDSQQQGENQNQAFSCNKTFHDDLLHIDSKCWALCGVTEPLRPVRFEVVNN